MRHSNCLLTVILALAAVAGRSTESAAQGLDPVFPAPQLLIGYVANAPQQLVGAGAAWLPPFLGGWGLYADYKMDLDTREEESNFIAGITGEEALAGPDDPRVNDHSYESINVAIVRAFRDDLIFYLGGGVTRETVYTEFFDPSGDRGEFGHYWVTYEDLGGLRPTALGGMFFRLGSRLAAQFGFEGLPKGITVGMHLAL